jgi:hypothetical protein
MFIFTNIHLFFLHTKNMVRRRTKKSKGKGKGKMKYIGGIFRSSQMLMMRLKNNESSLRADDDYGDIPYTQWNEKRHLIGQWRDAN